MINTVYLVGYLQIFKEGGIQISLTKCYQKDVMLRCMVVGFQLLLWSYRKTNCCL